MKRLAAFAISFVAVGLTACSENAEERSSQEAAEAAEPQNLEAITDPAPVTREAVSDTEAALNAATGEVGQAFEGSEKAASNTPGPANGPEQQQ